MQTPDGSLLDIIRNAYDLLSSCNIKIPEVQIQTSCNFDAKLSCYHEIYWLNIYYIIFCQLLYFSLNFLLKLSLVIVWSSFVILQIEGNEKYADSGPPYLIFLHPALGPLWEITRQKVGSQSLIEKEQPH